VPKIKIAFVHNNCKSFRYPVFKNLALNNDLEIDFFFLEEPFSKIPRSIVLKSFRVPLMQDFVYPFNLYKELTSKNYDYVISTDLGYVITYVSFVASTKIKAKFLLWNEQWRTLKHPRRFLTSFFEKKICGNSHKILSFGSKHIDFTVSMGAQREVNVLCPNAVPDDFLHIPPSKPKYFEQPSEYILCLARLISIKGQDTLISAFNSLLSQYPNIKLVIAGEGPEYKRYKKLIDSYGISDSVYMPNKKVDISEKKELIENAKCLVLPSKNWRAVEAWGLVVNEAVMVKTPVVVSDHTGVADDFIKNNETGFVFKESDVESLRISLIKVFSDIPFVNKLTDAAYKNYKDFYNIDKLTDTLTEVLYEE
jgi:glycosyltransferase involved in cell wall biosynthesis